MGSGDVGGPVLREELRTTHPAKKKKKQMAFAGWHGSIAQMGVLTSTVVGRVCTRPDPKNVRPSPHSNGTPLNRYVHQHHHGFLSLGWILL